MATDGTIRLGNLALDDVKLGSWQVDKIYLGSALLWEKGTPSPVPSGYTALQYIQGTGNSYFVIDYKLLNYNPVMDFSYIYLGENTAAGSYYGIVASSGYTAFSASATAPSYDIYPHLELDWSGNMDSASTNWHPSEGDLPLGQTYTITLRNRKFTFPNGNTYTAGTRRGSYYNNMGIMCTYNYTTKAISGIATDKMRLVHLRFANLNSTGTTTTERFDFYPAKRNSDNAVGLYDSVSGTFYTSSTSTPFTAGPNL